MTMLLYIVGGFFIYTGLVAIVSIIATLLTYLLVFIITFFNKDF